jgi:hypothetical protein
MAEAARQADKHHTLTPTERVKRILDEAVGRDLSSKEKHEFLPRTLTERLESWLREIEKRLGLAEVRS